MKHKISITYALLGFFFVAQIIGLLLVSISIEVKTTETGEKVVTYKEAAIERPDFTPETSFVSIIGAVFIGTLLALLLIKLRWLFVWKMWFFLAVMLTMYVSLGTLMPRIIAFTFALLLAVLKIFKPNIFTQNLSELLIYPGIVIIFFPMLDVFWMFMLLILISFYDMYAVWKSKHMIKMAKFQSRSKTFAGLYLPYKTEKKGKEIKTAMLGGGDVAFPMLFSGVVMSSLVNEGLSKTNAFFETMIISVFVTIALGFILVKGKPEKYYPAMPFITLGCILGYAVLLLL